MTTIAYKDGILAADTRAYSGTAAPIGHKQKIFQNEDGTAFGVATPTPGLAEEFVKWFMSGKEADYEPRWENQDFDILEITAQGDVFFYHDSIYAVGPLTAEYFAIGSGSEYAMGAMAMGATAVEAVSAASIHDAWTAAPIQMVTVVDETGEDADIEDAEVVEEEKVAA